MAIEKSIGGAPMGLEDLGEAVDVEIEVILDNEGEEEVDSEPEDDEFDENLAEKLDEETLTVLSSTLVEEVEADMMSRKDWIQTYVDGLELLGMKIEERTEPWEGACGVYHPLLAEAVVKFQAETMMETFPAQGPVKTQIIGQETPAKRDAGVRVREDMNYQLTERMVEYRPEHERMLWGLGLSGNAFKKVYFDPSLGRQVAMYIPAEDAIVPYGASSLEGAERVTHIMRKLPNDVRKLQVSGFYRDVELSDPSDSTDEVERKIAEQMGFDITTDERLRLLEIHTYLDLKGYEDKDEDGEPTGVALPYVVTIVKDTGTVLAIRRNWYEDDPKKTKRNHFVHYGYVPGFGFYAFGLIHLVGAFAKSGTSIIRQLVDAGTLSNLPGGFKTKGLRIKGDDTPISPGEFRDVDVTSGVIRDNILPLPYKEPSQVLYSLLNTIVDEGRRFANAADLKVADMSAQAPVGTTLAILERTLKLMTAVQARIHYSMRQEFRLLKNIIRDYTDDEYDYEPVDGPPRVKREDYDMVDVLPVSDPNSATMAQKIMQYQAVMQLAAGAPQLYDMPYLHRQMLEALGIRNISKLVPMADDEDMRPRDPVSENMAVLNGKPVKAFLHQDHESHILVHTLAMQDPEVAKVMGQNPQAQVMMAAMNAHISEHLGFAYRKRIEDAIGAPYPEPGVDLDPAMEREISRLAAEAARKVSVSQAQKAAAEQAQAAQQDPLVQMQQKELELKAKEVGIKERQMALDAAAKVEQFDIERERIAAQERTAGLNAGLKIATDKANIDIKAQAVTARSALDAARLFVDADSNQAQQGVSAVSAIAQLAAAANSVTQQQQKPETKPEGDAV